MFRINRHLILAAVVSLALTAPASAQIIASGALTALNTSVGAYPQASPSLTIGVRGTFAGTITFECTPDNTNYGSVLSINIANGNTDATTTTAGNFAVPNFGCQRIRARMSTYGSGSASITITRGYTSSSGAGSSGVGGSFPSSIAIANGGNTATVNGSGQLSVGDGGGTLSIDDGAGSISIDDGGSSITVDGTMTVTQTTGTNLHMVCDAGCTSTSGFSDNSAFTFGATQVNPIAGVLDDVATSAATENSAAVARITAQKGLHTNLRNAAGTEIGTAAAPVRTDPTGTTTQPVSDGGGFLSIDDGGSTISIDDGAGSITIDGTVAATQSGTWTVRTQDGGGNSLTSAARGSERALSVQLVDSAGNQITSFGGTGGTASNFASAVPATGTAVGFSDGTNMQAARVYDTDTGAGAQFTQGVVLRKSANAGSVELGTNADPVRTDPTGTTTQPVSGTVTTTPPANASTNVAQMGGVTTSMNTGVRDTGTQRVTIATNDLVPTNISQMNGVAVTMGNGTSGTGVQRVTLASDSTGTVIATQATGTNLHTVCDSGCSGGTQYTQDAALTVATTIGTMAAGRASAAAPTDVSADNDAVIPWYLRSGAQVGQATFAGVLATTGNGTTTTGTQRVTIASDSTGTVDTEFATAVASADNLGGPTAPWVLSANMCWDSAGTNWDRCAPTTAGSGVIDANTTRVTIATDDPLEANLVAHDAADAGNPTKVGFKATTSIAANTMVANNDRTNAFAGIDGIQITRPYANLEDRVSGLAAVTDGSSTSLVAAQGAGVRFCATTFIVSNSSATNVTLDIRDGTGGGVILTIPAAANMGGAVISLAVPLCTTANTAMAADPSAAATTVTTTAIGFKTKL